MIKKAFLKIISLLIIVGMNWSAISLIGGTDAHFYDIEESPNNLFSTAKLDFSLDFLMSDGFRTQTQGGWGAKPKGNNPGFYRDENFGSTFSFPDGLTIGNIDYYDALCMSTVGEVGDYYANFSSSEVIEDFLPAKGTPAVFLQSYNDPLDTEAGILAGQVVALTLNIGFDNDDPDFSVNEGKLADFYANEAGSLCEEMTTGEVLAEANLILSGGSSEFSPSRINECVTEINEKFVDGERTKITTSESVWRSIVIEKYDGLNFKYTIKIEQISEDSDLCDELKVGAYLNGELVYSGNLLDIFNEEPEEPIVFSESTNSWKLYIGLGEDTPSTFSNKSCEFKYIISGWQEDINILGGGFSDVEEIFDLVESGEWVSASEKSLDISDGLVLSSSDSDTSDDDDTDTDTDDMKEEDSDDSEGDDDTKKDDDADDTQEGSDDAEDGDDTEEEDADTEDPTALQDNGASEDDGDGSAEGSTQDDEASDGDDNIDADTGDMKEEDDSDDTDADDMKEEDGDTDTDDMKEEDGGDVEDEGDTEKDDDTDADDMKEEDDENAKPETGDDENDDVNGSTDRSLSRTEIWEDNVASDDEEDDGNDNTEGSAQDDGAQDGPNKNMVDSVQASV